MKIELVENDLMGCYARITYDDGNERECVLTKGEAMLAGMIIALQLEVEELTKKISGA